MVQVFQCSICETQKSQGIQLLDQHICGECEQKIVNTTSNHLEYALLQVKVKEIWNYFLTHL